MPDLSGGCGRVDAFADIDGIPGESVNARHADEIDVFSLSWCVTNAGGVGGGGGAGRPSFDNIVLGKHTDLATVPLVEAAATGQQIQDAVITLERAGATPFAFLVIELEDVRVTRVSTGWEGNQPDEQVSVSFAEVCWESAARTPPAPPARPAASASTSGATRPADPGRLTGAGCPPRGLARAS